MEYKISSIQINNLDDRLTTIFEAIKRDIERIKGLESIGDPLHYKKYKKEGIEKVGSNRIVRTIKIGGIENALRYDVADSIMRSDGNSFEFAKEIYSTSDLESAAD